MLPNRVDVEDFLLASYPQLRPFGSQYHVIDKDGSFGSSSLGYALYATGRTQKGYSPQRPAGLAYFGENGQFAVGYFDGKLSVVAPRGKGCVETVTDLAKQLKKKKRFANIPVYVRFLDENLLSAFMEKGWLGVEAKPWISNAPSEDETYWSSVVTIDDVIDQEGRIKTLQGSDSKNFRCKNRGAFNAFRNFMERNDVSLSVVPYEKRHEKDAHHIGKSHFDMLGRAGKVVGSSWEDYANIVDPDFLVEISDTNEIFARIGFLERKGAKVPVMLFVGESLDQKMMGLYASLTLRDKGLVLPELDIDPEIASGFYSGLSTYANLTIFDELRHLGNKSVHLGGSETQELDNFKRRLGAKPYPSYWVVDSG